jgi:hypothetical protein
VSLTSQAEHVVEALEKKPDLLVEVVRLLKWRGHIEVPSPSKAETQFRRQFMDGTLPSTCPVCHQPSHPHDCR